MVINIGSMAVKAVFNGAGLLSGLGKTSDKFKEVSLRSKSTTTEMKRMQHGAHTLRNALAAIGVGGFTALLLTTPQLAGSLAKIKYEMTQLAWSIGKHLKPSLDAVATILRGIRTGDWSVIIGGIDDLTTSLITLAALAAKVIVNLVFGEGTYEKLEEDFLNWKKNLEEAWGELDLSLILKIAIVDPLKWIGDLQRGMMTDLEGEWGEKKGERHRDFWSGIGNTIRELQTSGLRKEHGGNNNGSYQIGGYVPQTGLYNLHAGETVTMKGSNGMSNNMGSSNITLDFSGANINLASGIELDEFANQISLKIAERQNTLTY